jgi:hypothetical protein
MKSLIAALVFVLAMYVSAQTQNQTTIKQTPDSKQTVTTTDTKTTISKDGKTTKKITKKIIKNTNKKESVKSCDGCTGDDAKECPDKKDSK